MSCHCWLPAQIDAFTATPFAGNPAAVVLLPPGAALSDELRAQIGAEVSNSMTAFLEPLSDDGEPCAGGRDSSEFASGRQYRIRWFASTDGEYRICGHATIASAAALLQGRNPSSIMGLRSSLQVSESEDIVSYVSVLVHAASVQVLIAAYRRLRPAAS